MKPRRVWTAAAAAGTVASLVYAAVAFAPRPVPSSSSATVARCWPPPPPRFPPPRPVHAARDGDEEGDPLLLSRRELLLPALLSLGSGIAILTGGIRDERAYDAEHRALFAAVEDRSFRRILEIGIGEGANVPYYPAGSRVTGTDPFLKRDALAVAQRKAQARNVALTVAEAAAEQLPFPDGSFDCVVSTLVFCTVSNPVKALSEVSRVLRGGGKFIFVEHIRAEAGTFLRAQQEALNPLQQLLAGGCHLTRETDRLFQAAAGAAEATSFAGGATAGPPPLFSSVERWDYLEQGSKWPIVRQVAGVLVK